MPACNTAFAVALSNHIFPSHPGISSDLYEGQDLRRDNIKAIADVLLNPKIEKSEALSSLCQLPSVIIS